MIHEREWEGYPGIVLGRGEHLRWYRCNGCNEWVNGDEDSGRWKATQPCGVWCARCYADGRMGQTSQSKGQIESKAPLAYAHATFEALTPAAQKFLKDWPDKKPFVVVAGIPGSGKTYAGWAIEKRACLHGRRIRVESARGIRSYWATHLEYRERIEAGLGTCRYLLLDGLTDSTATDGWAQLIQGVMDARWNAKLPTLITTMDEPHTIEKSWGVHILSRLRQYHWLKLPDKDQRPGNKLDAAD